MKESDWRHFRDITPKLRERYLSECNARIADLLTRPDKNETERFWDAMEEMKKEAKVLGRCLDGHSRSKMWLFMLSMIGAGMLKKEDMAVFSEDLQKEVSYAYGMKEPNPSDSSRDNRKPVVLRRADWASHDQLWKGKFEGKDLGTKVTVLFYATEEIGEGPRWHVHPYDEIFILREGRALFTVGSEKIEARAGDILLGPANIPHKYHNLGPGILETTDIHLSESWIQTDLEDPECLGG